MSSKDDEGESGTICNAIIHKGKKEECKGTTNVIFIGKTTKGTNAKG
jgi:hypothetical protein